MKQRQLGNSGLYVSAIGLGCMGMSTAYGEMDEKGSIETIRHALDIGVTLLNTSDAYGNGANEELIAKAIKGRRDSVVLATKFGQIHNPAGGHVDGRPDYVQAACEASLKRLRVDTIDLYHQHRVDPDTPIEETVGALSRLVEQGKVRHVGLSEASARTIRRAHAVHPITALESEYSLWSREVEAEILPTCRELGIGFIAYAPIGRGFLSGAFKSADDLIDADRRRDLPRFSDENIRRNYQLVSALKDKSDEMRLTPAQLAIAWLLAQGDDIVPIPGTQRVAYLEENVGAAEIVLDPGTIEHLNTVFQIGAASGERYNRAQMLRIDF